MRGQTCSEKVFSLKIFRKSALEIRRLRVLIKKISSMEVYGKMHRIPLGHDILKDHGAFFPRALSDELLFELRLAPAGSVLKGSDPTRLYYELTDIQLDYEVIHSQKLADEALSNYKNGKRFMYEHITHLKTISVDKGSDTIVNESINVPRRSMKGLLLLLYETYTAGTRNSEKTFNPNITDVKLTVDGIPNKIYSQGMQARDIWEEVFRRFGKENSAMNATDIYTGDRFGLFIDLRSMRDNDLHGSGLRLVNTKDGVHLPINRKGSASGNVKCHIFILSDAQLNIVNRELEKFSDADECRTLVFRPEKSFHGKRLTNHVIRIVEVMTKKFCENMCYMEPTCVSINLDKRVCVNGNYKCELNNVPHEGHELREEENYFYHAAEMLMSVPREYMAAVLMLCAVITRDRTTVHVNRYFLEMGELAKPTFHFDSKFWSDMDDFNLQGGETGFDLQETKLPTYWNTSFTKICLGMELNGESRSFIAIQKQASSLYSLIADGHYRDTLLGRYMWKSLISSEASLQPHCSMEGFNTVVCRTHSKARTGIIANKNNYCNSSDSRIGFGKGRYGDDSNTCGNEAKHGGDNGNKHIKAMGYFLVQ
ncbi:hypothetical protein AWC38_SpisGene23950 [Stylophora pistillata]|uniref:Uncharacterized protein n=1 Tax=Stylophora pistillata TaxID=50429 RepID=A0A2B4R6M8_STYPI|nr:hypothetical protein AWC38_SpisGene23950 [Stylophora pistillata]